MMQNNAKKMQIIFNTPTPENVENQPRKTDLKLACRLDHAGPECCRQGLGLGGRAGSPARPAAAAAAPQKTVRLVGPAPLRICAGSGVGARGWQGGGGCAGGGMCVWWWVGFAGGGFFVRVLRRKSGFASGVRRVAAERVGEERAGPRSGGPTARGYWALRDSCGWGGAVPGDDRREAAGMARE